MRHYRCLETLGVLEHLTKKTTFAMDEKLGCESALDGKITELRSRLNGMEMLSELDKADIKKLATELYFENILGGMNDAVSETIDRYSNDPTIRLEVANSILESLGMDKIESCEKEDVFEMFMSRF